MKRVVAAVLACLMASPAWAQDSGRQASSEFAGLRQKLRTGESLIVSIDSGTQIRGRLQDVNGAHIVVLADEVRRDIPAEQVTRVQRRRNGVALGAVIGAGVGVAFGLAARSYAYNEGGSEGAALLLPIGAGLGVGIAIDALLVVPRTVYQRIQNGHAAR